MSALTLRLYVDRIEFYAFHGFTDEEQSIGHRYVLSLDARVATQATETDELSDAVDYGTLSSRAVELAQAPQARLMEHVVHRVANQLLEEFPAIRVLTVTLAKRLPPIPFVAEEAGVALTVSR